MQILIVDDHPVMRGGIRACLHGLDATKRDYKATIRAVDRPLRVIAGQDDELFHSDRFEAVFRAEGNNVPADLIAGVGHIGLSLVPRALRAAVEAVNQRLVGLGGGSDR